MTGTRIQIHQLSKRYRGDHYALRDVDLDIGNGMFGLLGPNGAGKTTLIRILVALLRPTSGKVTVDGMDLQRDRHRIRRMVGYLPQDYSPCPDPCSSACWRSPPRDSRTRSIGQHTRGLRR